MREMAPEGELLQRLAAASAALGRVFTVAETLSAVSAQADNLGFAASVAIFVETELRVQLESGAQIDLGVSEPHAIAIRTQQPMERDGLWVLPLQSSEKILGAMSIRFFALPPRDADRAAATIFAQACANALDRARLDQAERQVRAEAYRIYGQLETLARAGTMSSTPRDVDATVRTVVALPLSEFADGCIFEAMDEDLPTLEVAHVQPEQEQAIRNFLGPEPSFRNPALREWARDAIEPRLLEVSDKFWEASEPQQTAALERLKMRALIIVPLQERGRRIGMLTFVRMLDAYEEADLPFAAELSRRLSSVLENARLYDEARRAIQLRDDFISIAAHELKTPLAALQMRLSMLVGKVEGTPTYASAVRCESYARDLSALVNQLLDVTRMAAGQLRLDLEPVDIVQVVRDVVARQADVAHQAGAQIRLVLPVRLVGVWDKIKLEQVVGNLLANAIKYGQGAPIAVSIAATDKICELVVHDAGGGIDPEEQNRIFRRFHRLTTSGGGFGLGLWIVKQVVEALGGTVQVDSALGAGATFTVSLPLSR
jgi:signal transduction histidine kinase